MRRVRNSNLVPVWHGVLRLGLVVLMALVALAVRAQPANDNFADAEELTGIWGQALNDNADATFESGEPSHAGLPPRSSIWYKWTAPMDGEVTLDTLGSGPDFFGLPLDTLLAVYTGSELATLNQVAANDDLYPFSHQIRSGRQMYLLPYTGPSLVRFNAKAGTTYYIAVDAKFGGGPTILNFAYNPAGAFRFATEDFEGGIQPRYECGEYESIADDESTYATYYQYDPGGLLVTVTRVGGSAGRALVDYATVDLEPTREDDMPAVAGQDYLPAEGTLVFDNFEMSKTILIRVFPSFPPAMTNRIFGLTLSNPRLADDESPDVAAPRLDTSFSTAFIRILDQDIDPVFFRNFTTISNEDGEITEFTGPTNKIFTFAKKFLRLPEDVNDYYGNAGFWIYRYGTNRGGATVHYRICNFLGSNQDSSEQENNYFPLLAGSDYATPTPENDGSLSLSSDYVLAQGTVGFGDGDFQPKRVTFTVTNDPLTEFSEDFHIFLYIEEDNRVIVPGTVCETKMTILFDDRDPPAGSVDQFHNPDRGVDMKPPVTTDPPNLDRPGADGTVFGLAIQPDGKTVIGGQFGSYNGVTRNGVARMNVNGSLDVTFNPGDGIGDPYNDFVACLALAPNGKIVIGGNFSFFNGAQRNGIARLNDNGSLDASFNPQLGANGTVWAVAVQSDNKVIIGGSFTSYNGTNAPYLARLNADGSLDTTFNIGANPPNGPVQALVLTPSGQILIGGEFTQLGTASRNRIARLGTDGTLDSTFQPGAGADDTVYALAVQSDSRILVGGEFMHFNLDPHTRLVRLNSNGTVDESFNPGSGPNDTVYCINPTATGAIYVGGLFTRFNGTHRLGFTRLYADGTADTTFLDTAYNQFAGLHRLYFDKQTLGDPRPFVYATQTQADGNVMIGGGFNRVGGGQAESSIFLDPAFPPESYNQDVWVEPKSRNGYRNRSNVARLIGGATDGPGNISLIYTNYSLNKAQSFLTVALLRENGTLGYASANFGVVPSVAQSGLDYVYNAAAPLYLSTWLPIWFPSQPGIDSRMHSHGLFGTNTVPTDLFGHFWYGYTPGQVTVTLRNSGIAGDRTAQLQLANPAGADQFFLGGENIPLGCALGRSLVPFKLVDDTRRTNVLSFSASAYKIDEFTTNAVITVIRTNGSAGSVSVNYATSDGTAKANVNYRPVSGRLTFGPGVTNQTFSVPIIDDTTINPTGLVVNLRLSGVSGASLGISSATLKIVDNDWKPGFVSFESDAYATNESNGEVTLKVIREGANRGTVSVQCQTVDQTAIQGVKYVGVTNTLVWNDGDSTPRFVTVPLIRDGLVGPNTTFGVILTNAIVNTTNSPMVLAGTPVAATVTIIDDDQYGVLEFSAPSYLVNEIGGYATLTVRRTGGSAQALTVGYVTTDGTAYGSATATTITNYISSSGVLNFAPGEVAKSFIVPILDDGVQDLLLPSQFFFTVTLTNPNPAGILGLQSTATVNIVDAQGYNVPSGSVDTTFNPDPGFNGDVYALALQADGRILVGGDFTTANRVIRHRLARLHPDASLDITFLAGLSGANAPVQTLLVQSDGRLLVGGNFTTFNGVNRSRVARLIADGTLDSSFNPGTAADNTVFALAETFIGPDRCLLVGGSFTTFNGAPRGALVRLNEDGTLDSRFNPNLTINGTVFAIAVYPTNSIQAGKILVGGEFNNVNGLGRSRLARLHPDGRIDPTFDPGTGADATVRALAIQLDGRVLVGGSFTNYNGQLVNRITRLNVDGSVDATFNTTGPEGEVGLNDTVQAIVLQPDNRILLAGQFTRANGLDRRRITRLMPDGSADPSINFGTGADNYIAAMALQADGHIVIGGGFSRYDDYPRERIARLFGGSMSGSGWFEFTSAEFLADENSTNAVVTVRRRGGTAGFMTIDFATSDGTAVAGVNYSNVATALEFPSGETFQSVTIPLIDNLLIGSNLTVNLALSNPLPPSNLGNQPVAVLTIVNDDSAVAFSAEQYFRNEDAVDGAATIQVVRQGSLVGTATVDLITTTNGTALAYTNYVPVTNTLIFEPGQTVASVKIPVLRDPRVQGDTTVIMRLTNNFNTLLFAPSEATLNILDVDKAPGVLGFAATNYLVVETNGLAAVTVVRTNGRTGVVSVSFRTEAGTAQPGIRYVSTNGVLSFADGETSKTLGVRLLNTPSVEGDQFFRLVLSNPTGGASLAPLTNTTVTIMDDEIGVGFSSPIYIANETGGSVTLTLNRIGTNGVTTVSYATTNGTALAGTNYQSSTGTLTFTNGEAIKTFNISLVHDPRVTGDLSFNVNLLNPTPPAQLFAPGSATVVVLDSDPGFAFTNASFYTVKSGTNVLISVLRSNANTGTVSVNYATTNGTAEAGIDYAATSGTLIFSNGVALQTFTVPIINNRLVRGDREFTIGLFNPSPGAQLLEPRIASVTITDDVAGLRFSAPAYNISEKGVAATINVLRTGFTNSAVSVNYATAEGTARAGANYINVSGTLTFTNGETLKSFTVPVINNNVVEGDKTVLLNLTDVSGNAVLVSPSAATLTIIEADGSLILPSGTALVSESGPVNGVVDPGETVRLLFGLRNAAGTNTQNLVATLLATNGIVNPSGPQNYGALTVRGPTVSREFEFTAAGTNGQRITATFHLQDGLAENQAVFNFTLGKGTVTFSNMAPIVIRDATNALPYPSVINVSGVGGSVSKAEVMLTNLSHTWPSDINILLVSPEGQKSYLMSKCGGALSVQNITLKFDDMASQSLPQAARMTNGTYEPTAYAVAPPPFPVPAPPATPTTYQTNLSAFNGSNPNGAWSLYVFDDTPLYSGSISNGWVLTLTTSDLVPASSDLGVAISASAASVVANSNLTYVVTLTNFGPATASNVVVSDVLPPGVDYVGYSASQGALTTNAGVASWNVGTLARDGAATLSLVLRPTLVGVFTNTVTVAASTFDPNPDNNAAVAVVEVLSPVADLAVSLAGTPNPLVPGNPLTYTITVNNLGPATATGVAITNILPAGAAFVSASPAGHVVLGGEVVFTNLGSLGSGMQTTVSVVVRPQVPGEITGTATCGSEILDPLKANNTASVKTIVEALHLEFGRSGSSLVIAWPASAANAVLEGASSLAPPVVWLPVTNPPPVEANGLKSVTLPIGSGSGYYRLRLNAP
jgi:uncharacterized delta-60 repeat protein/uncharacterized repeat protein (TIGR01451 family)